MWLLGLFGVHHGLVLGILRMDGAWHGVNISGGVARGGWVQVLAGGARGFVRRRDCAGVLHAWMSGWFRLRSRLEGRTRLAIERTGTGKLGRRFELVGAEEKKSGLSIVMASLGRNTVYPACHKGNTSTSSNTSTYLLYEIYARIWCCGLIATAETIQTIHTDGHLSS